MAVAIGLVGLAVVVLRSIFPAPDHASLSPLQPWPAGVGVAADQYTGCNYAGPEPKYETRFVILDVHAPSETQAVAMLARHVRSAGFTLGPPRANDYLAEWVSYVGKGHGDRVWLGTDARFRAYADANGISDEGIVYGSSLKGIAPPSSQRLVFRIEPDESC
ncbi:MAG: hypothetical protein JWN67_3874 [Actinomycetia bacterium]|nr:hypothetical protein [Actinomycetes bacterium]